MANGEEKPIAIHVSVLPKETIALLDPKPGEIWVDATTGIGGHTSLIRNRIGEGRVLAIDQDDKMLALAKQRIHGDGVEFIQGSFDEIGAILRERGMEMVDGLLADLGFCSDQLQDAERGLSFQTDGPLDMRLNQSSGPTAKELVNTLPERQLADLIYEYGEERKSFRIARKIVETRQNKPINTTGELANLIRSCLPAGKNRFGRVDAATRVFQALRIAVNDEIQALNRLLRILPSVIRPGGRVGIISFHSLEDRLVKHALRDSAKWETVTKKPVQASAEEIQANPRSRSAKLRVARRLAN